MRWLSKRNKKGWQGNFTCLILMLLTAKAFKQERIDYVKTAKEQEHLADLKLLD